MRQDNIIIRREMLVDCAAVEPLAGMLFGMYTAPAAWSSM